VVISDLSEWELSTAPVFSEGMCVVPDPANPTDCQCFFSCEPNPNFGGAVDCDSGGFVLRYNFTLTDGRQEDLVPLNNTEFTVWTPWQGAAVLPVDQLLLNFESGEAIRDADLAEVLNQTTWFDLGVPNEYVGRTNFSGVGEFAVIVISMPYSEVTADTCGQVPCQPGDACFDPTTANTYPLPTEASWEVGEFPVCVQSGGAEVCSQITGSSG
jgi:hypothetical protein